MAKVTDKTAIAPGICAWACMVAIVAAVASVGLQRAQSTPPASQPHAGKVVTPAGNPASMPYAARASEPWPNIEFTSQSASQVSAKMQATQPASIQLAPTTGSTAPVEDRAITFAPVEITAPAGQGEGTAMSQGTEPLAPPTATSVPAVALPSVVATNPQSAGIAPENGQLQRHLPEESISFRTAERPDPFVRPAPSAVAQTAPAASPAVLSQQPEAPQGARAPDAREPDIQISEFRFVNIADDSLRSVPQNVAGQGSPSSGGVATAIAQGPVEAQASDKEHKAMPANAFAEALQAAQEKALQASGPPAPLTEDWNEPRPIAGTSSVNGTSNGPGAQAQLPSGCPYNPGDSGTHTVCGVDCGGDVATCDTTWNEAECIPWSLFGPGEYVGPARPEHVSSYYLRVNDLITLTFINSRRKDAERYRLGVGDRLKLEWLQAPSETDVKLDREITVQPDGTISLPLVGDVIADGKTIKELREELIRLYSRYQREPQITVTPIEVNTAIQDILSAVTSISGSNGQTQALRVTPEGTIQAPALGSVYVQGLTIEEARAELEARYAAKYGPGLMVSPSLTERAASFVFVGGEVQAPGRYSLEGPTTVMQAIALAGGWNNGGNLRQVVIFRRDENWCLKATKIDIRAPYFGNDPCPTNDVWLRDNDLVIVPKSKILCATDVINLYFTRGVYAAFPISYVYSFNNGSSVTPIISPGP